MVAIEDQHQSFYLVEFERVNSLLSRYNSVCGATGPLERKASFNLPETHLVYYVVRMTKLGENVFGHIQTGQSSRFHPWVTIRAKVACIVESLPV